jgi:protein-tyrosine phosphatase
MFGLFKRKAASENSLEKFPFNEVMVDMHSHLIPAIDDGSKSDEETVSLLKEFEALGYKKIITTPHILAGLYNNTPEIIKAGEAKVKALIKENNINLSFKAAAEHMMDDNFDRMVANKTVLPLKDNWVLVECSFAAPPLDIESKLFSLEIKGFQPVLAHPERYTYWYKNRSMFDTLKERGVLFQLNLASLAGYYGKEAQELATYLIKKNYINLVGSDCHGKRHIEAMKNISMNSTIESLFKYEKLENKWLLED